MRLFVCRSVAARAGVRRVEDVHRSRGGGRRIRFVRATYSTGITTHTSQIYLVSKIDAYRNREFSGHADLLGTVVIYVRAGVDIKRTLSVTGSAYIRKVRSSIRQ